MPSNIPSQPSARLTIGREVLDLPGVEQPGHPRAQQKADDDIFGAADVAVAVAQAVEDQVGEDVAYGDDRERGQRGLHALAPSAQATVSRAATWQW